MPKHYRIFPIGRVKKTNELVTIEIDMDYQDALGGLEQFSHIIVLCWLHRNDTAERRSILKVHPRGDPNNPLTGVFATRSPVRPNLISLSTCKIISLRGGRIQVDRIDAFDGTPVIDIKPCIARTDWASDIRVPVWAE